MEDWRVVNWVASWNKLFIILIIIRQIVFYCFKLIFLIQNFRDFSTCTDVLFS